MSRKTPVSTLDSISEINLTPLMDLTFILLITFIITFPLIEQGIPVNLPKASSTPIESDAELRSITVDDQGGLFLDERAIDEAELIQDMTRLGQTSPDVTVLIRADETIEYKKVVNVLKILHEAQIVKISLVTEADR